MPKAVDPIGVRIGAWARDARETIGISPNEMAVLLDMTYSNLMKIETGVFCPRLITILDIAAHPGISPLPTLAAIIDEHMSSPDDLDYERG